MIRIQNKGNFSKTFKFLNTAQKLPLDAILRKYGESGVLALSQATPKDSGKTAKSWGYTISKTKNGASITWTNDNVVNGIPVAILLQYGHGTRNGGYVQGVDFINPAIKKSMEDIANNLWMEVTK